MRPVREYGFLSQPVELHSFGFTPDDLKREPQYAAAKSGDAEAAFFLVGRLIWNMEIPFPDFPPGARIVVPHAVEATGDNAIPEMVGAFLAARTGCRQDDNVVQTNKVFHTGADAMQRLIARHNSPAPSSEAQSRSSWTT